MERVRWEMRAMAGSVRAGVEDVRVLLDWYSSQNETWELLRTCRRRRDNASACYRLYANRMRSVNAEVEAGSIASFLFCFVSHASICSVRTR